MQFKFESKDKPQQCVRVSMEMQWIMNSDKTNKTKRMFAMSRYWKHYSFTRIPEEKKHSLGYVVMLQKRLLFI